MKNVTLKDVARAAGVSYSTVSRSLSGSPQIGRETRERILRLCDEMGYTKNYVARSISCCATPGRICGRRRRW